MRVVVFLCFLFLGQFVFGQVELQIVDRDTKEPLVGALVVATSSADSLFVVSDENGLAVINLVELPAELRISYLGYVELRYTLKSAEQKLTLELLIDELNIAVNPIIIANPFLSNDISFNRKEFQVLPGAYEDPSRLLLKAPGFATANDQANSILFKGMPSNFVNWNVNGALVVNPNHLSNAGTLSDISSANAGGVNMISGQVIGSYDFQSAPYKTPANNAIAGNSNVEFSNYNNNYLNLSLVGLEAGLAYKGVQLNYRYSTVGILTGVFGLDFGGEEIVYQDLFTKFEIINKADEKLTAHLVLGQSHNYKDAVMEIDSAETFKDVQDIRFDSEILVGGIRYQNNAGKFAFDGSLNFSMKEDFRMSSDIIYDSRQETRVQQQVLSSVLQFSKANFKFGANMHYIDDARFDLVYEPRERFSVKRALNNFNVMPFVNYEQETERFYFSAGSGISFSSVTSDINFEPHLKGIAQLGRGFELEAGYRRNSQILSASSFSYDHEPDEIIGNHLETYIRYSKQNYTLFGSVFGHYMTNILVEDATNYSQ